MKISRNLKKSILERLTNHQMLKWGVVQPFTFTYDMKMVRYCNLTPHKFYKYLSNSLRTAGYPDGTPSNRDWWRSLDCLGFYSYKITKSKLQIFLFIVSNKVITTHDLALRTVNVCAFDTITGNIDQLGIEKILFDNMNILDEFSGLEMFGLTKLKNEMLF